MTFGTPTQHPPATAAAFLRERLTYRRQAQKIGCSTTRITEPVDAFLSLSPKGAGPDQTTPSATMASATLMYAARLAPIT